MAAGRRLNNWSTFARGALAAVFLVSAAFAQAAAADRDDSDPLLKPTLRLKKAAQARPIDRICNLIETHAERHALPKDYFARLIWKESRFDANAEEARKRFAN